MLVSTENKLTTEPNAADSALVAAAQKRDRAAFGALYARYRRMVHGILLAYTKPADAEDLMQDVFVQAMGKLSGLREPEAFGGWLTSIARRIAIDALRRRKDIVEINEGNCGSTRQRQAEMTLGLIRALPEAYRETLILRLVEGMTGPEIAFRTGLTPASVRVNLCRGMKLLRRKLGTSADE